MKVAFYGSSLLSSYWNGAATYYRGVLGELRQRGYQITFYEPDAFDRQAIGYRGRPIGSDRSSMPRQSSACRVLDEAEEADIVIKASGVGVFDRELLEGIVRASRPMR